MGIDFDKADKYYRQEIVNSNLEQKKLKAEVIKRNSEKGDVDVNKVYDLINRGDLSALVELDKAGVHYTLQEHSSAFGEKMGGFNLSFEYQGVNYTTEYKGEYKDKEKREEVEKQKPEAVNANKLLVSYSGIQVLDLGKKENENVSENLPKNAEEVDNEPNNLITNENENSSVSVSINTDVKVPNGTKADEIISSLMKTYSFSKEFAGLVLEYIADRAKTKSKNDTEYDEEFDNLLAKVGELTNPKNDDVEFGGHNLSQDSSRINSNDELKPSLYDTSDFYKYMYDKYFTNMLSKYGVSLYEYELGETRGNNVNDVINRMIYEYLGKDNYSPHSFWTISLEKATDMLDKNDNGLMDELFEIFQKESQKAEEYFAEKYGSAENKKIDEYTEKINKDLDLLQKEPSKKTYDHIIQTLRASGGLIKWDSDVTGTGENEGLHTLTFELNGKSYEIKCKDTWVDDTRKPEDISDEELFNTLANYHKQVWSTNRGFLLGLLGNEYHKSDIARTIKYLKESIQGEHKYMDMMDAVAIILNSEYGIDETSTDEEILAKVKEYFSSIGVTLSDESDMGNYMTLLDMDLVTRVPEYKLEWKERYINITREAAEQHKYEFEVKIGAES